MTWWAVDVRPPAEQRDVMGAWLVARTGLAVEERDDGTLVAFAPDQRAAELLIAELGQEVGRPVGARSHPVEDTDWSTRWREGLGPRRIEQLTIIPSWLPEAYQPDPLTIVLDPETAFGSGEHGSTRAALTLLARLLRPGSRILDLGSGSGILAIAAIKLGAARAIGIDTDLEANEVAVRNATRNQVADRIQFLEGDAAVLLPLLGPADLILSNILRSINVVLLPAIATTLRWDGIAIFSGMEHAESETFRSSLAVAGFTVIQETLDGGWWGVAARHAG
jgi:ribosomal protein L11 methyltransferase